MSRAVLSAFVALGLAATATIARGDSATPGADGPGGYWMRRAQLAESRLKQLETELAQLRRRLAQKSGCLPNESGPAGPAKREALATSRVGANSRTAASCSPPYSVVDGIKVYRDCVPQSATDSCVPPYRIDTDGVKHFLPECLQ